MTTNAQIGRRSLGTFEAQLLKRSNPYQDVEGQFGVNDRIALTVTGAIGTMYAVYALALWTAVWMLLQVALGRQAFDPYPFAFLLLVGSIIQLLLMPLLMVGQNLQGRHAEARAEEEFATVGKIFHDMGATLAHLDAQDQELVRQTRLLLALVEELLPQDRRQAAIAESRIEAGSHE